MLHTQVLQHSRAITSHGRVGSAAVTPSLRARHVSAKQKRALWQPLRAFDDDGSNSTSTSSSTNTPSEFSAQQTNGAEQQPAIDVEATDIPMSPLEQLENTLDVGPEDLPPGEEDEDDIDWEKLNTTQPSASIPAADMDELTRQKYNILLEIIQAGEAADKKVAYYAPQLDDSMLNMLQKRIDLSKQIDEGGEAVVRLEFIYSLIKYEVDRQQSTPAMRLLEDILSILGSKMIRHEDYQQRKQAATQRLREAFSGATTEVDIFSAASALAEAPWSAGMQLQTERVTAVDFFREVSELLQETKQKQAALRDDITRAEAEVDVAFKTNVQILESEQGKAFIAQLQHAKSVAATREFTILQLEDLLFMVTQIDEKAMVGGGEEGKESQVY